MLGGDLLQGVLEQCLALPAGVASFRARCGVGHVDAIVERRELDHPPAPQLVEGGVARDLQQPGGKARLGAPCGQGLPGLDEDVLGELHRLVAGVEHAQDEAEHAVLVTAHQGGEGGRVTRAGTGDIGFVGARAGVDGARVSHARA